MKKLMLIFFLSFITATTIQAQKISPMEFWERNQSKEIYITPLIELAQTLKEKINEGKVNWAVSDDKNSVFFSIVKETEAISDYDIAIVNKKESQKIFIRINNEIFEQFPFQDEEKEIFQSLIDYIIALDEKSITRNQLQRLNEFNNSLYNTKYKNIPASGDFFYCNLIARIILVIPMPPPHLGINGKARNRSNSSSTLSFPN